MFIHNVISFSSHTASHPHGISFHEAMYIHDLEHPPELSELPCRWITEADDLVEPSKELWR
jgi:hypothetical protein